MKNLATIMCCVIIILGTATAQFDKTIDFDVSTPIIKAIVKQGESVVNNVRVINYGKKQNFQVHYESEADFIIINKGDFNIISNSGDNFDVIFDSDDLLPGVYVGEVIVSTIEDNIRRIPIILEIESHTHNFDVSSNIGPRFSDLSPGDNLEVGVKIFNFGSESGDVLLNYNIKNLGGEIIFSEEQKLNVNNRAEIIKAILIPEFLDFGNYVFSVSAKDLSTGNVGTSSELFLLSPVVLQSPIYNPKINFYLGLALTVIIILIISFLIINYYWDRRVKVEAKDWKKKIIDVKKIKLGNTAREIKKLEYQRRLLEIAYDKGYIKNSSYLEGKKKLSSLIIKLKKRL